jgi:diaminohydroxyphosphoribosylaminopyrimidine deaminase/5-amino-6-(5-phosphoribosylamino)uracil reductase
VRVVVDRHLAVPPSARLIAEARQVPTWVLALSSADPVRRQALLASGVTVIEVDPDTEGGIDFKSAVTALGERGITRVLVEGGGQLAAALVRARLVDRLAWFHAPLLIGGDGIPAIAGLGLEVMTEVPRFERLSTEKIGDDLLTIFRIYE